MRGSGTRSFMTRTIYYITSLSIFAAHYTIATAASTIKDEQRYGNLVVLILTLKGIELCRECVFVVEAFISP